MRTEKDYLDHAKGAEKYFSGWAESNEEPMWARMGLEASRRWLRILEEGGAVEEARLLLEHLEKEKDRHGSGWLDLLVMVRLWLRSRGQDV